MQERRVAADGPMEPDVVEEGGEERWWIACLDTGKQHQGTEPRATSTREPAAMFAVCLCLPTEFVSASPSRLSSNRFLSTQESRSCASPFCLCLAPCLFIFRNSLNREAIMLVLMKEMDGPKSKGQIQVILGPMFSGKT